MKAKLANGGSHMIQFNLSKSAVNKGKRYKSIIAMFSRSAGSTVVILCFSAAGARLERVVLRTHKHTTTNVVEPSKSHIIVDHASLKAATNAYVYPTGAIAVAVRARRARLLSNFQDLLLVGLDLRGQRVRQH